MEEETGEIDKEESAKPAEVENKEELAKLAEVKETLNRKLKDSGVSFSNLQMNSDGTVGLDINMSAHRADPSFFIPKGITSKLVVPLKEKDFLRKFNLGNQYEDLLGKVNAMGVKDILKAVDEGKDVTEVVKQVKATQDTLVGSFKESALDLRFRSPLTPQDLDLKSTSVDEVEATQLYKRSAQEYERTGIYGSSVDVFTNFASSGFYNEISDPKIKNFFDSWTADVSLKTVVGKIFHNLYKYNVAIVMPSYGKYEPNVDGVSSIPGKEPKSEKASIAELIDGYCSKAGVKLNKKQRARLNTRLDRENAKTTSDVPVAYTLIDPKNIKIESSGFFGAETVTLTSRGTAGIRKALKRKEDKEASKEEVEKLKLLPKKLLAAARESEDYIFGAGEVFLVNLYKDDQTVYAKPRGARVFNSFDYKDDLIQADYATLDGIFNYILKVTVGDKDHPVTDMSILEDLAQAFNTPQKAFSVFWNHTLNIEKITTPDIGDILGKSKYEQVEMDISAGLGIARAFIDGSDIQPAAAVLSAKSLQSQIELARLQVENWIYTQYRVLAVGMSFDRYPAVRWRQSAVNTDTDAVARASIMQASDRKLSSQTTAMRDLGTDPDVEQNRIREEIPLEEEGVKISGSPFQATEDGPTPSGDQGRPKGQPKVTKKKVDDKKVVKRKTKVTSPSQQSASLMEEKASIETLLTEILELPAGKQEIALKRFLDLANKAEDGK